MRIVVALVIAGLSAISCQSDTSEPDMVVGIEIQCSVVNPSRTFEFQGAERCDRYLAIAEASGDDVFVGRHVQVLTIRTAGGTTYMVTIDAERDVSLGDTWPPE